MRNRALMYLVTPLLLATLWGCGSSLDSGGDQTAAAGGGLGNDPATGVAFAGAAACINCHKGFTWSSAAVSDYLAGKHVIHSDHITAANAAEGCLQCHDPVGDGRGIEGLIPAANVPATGLAAVTCEACHGAGGQHYGVGPMPVATPDYNACGKCHAALPANHLTYHPEANNIITDYLASGHLSAPDSHNSNVCSKCHTDEGARLYRDIDNVDRLETLVLAVPSPSQPVQCRTCHDSHNAGELLEAATTGTTGASAEYRTCTNCHQAHDANVGTTKRTLAGSTSTDGASADGDLIYHATRWNRVITSTHFDNPATTGVIEGYAINKKSERACRDCHNVHAANIAINEEWAESAHGGDILEAKLAAVAPNGSANYRTIQDVINIKAAGATDATAPGWVHYDWDSASRQSCQRCHTATGVKNFLTAPATYNAANNDFSHLSGWKVNADSTITSSGQNEMLYCWGCHANNSGALRNPGALTISYSNGASAAFPDVGPSNVCMACHTGRENGASIANSTGDFTNLSFINSHYLTAGATVFNLSGYEFAGQSYDTIGYHKQVGVSTASIPTGTDGPCVTCHMSTGAGHTFGFLTKDAAGVITANNSTVCNTCHGDLTAADLQSSKVEFTEALEALKAALADKGIHFGNAHPYFYTAPYVAGGTNTAFKNWDGVYPGKGKDVMGAAFNYNLLEHDPGAYAHNNGYAVKLIADSIDFLNDGLVDGDVNAATELFGQGVNIGSGTDRAAIHDTVAAPSEATCSACHSSGPHYGGSEAYATGGTWSGTAWSGTTGFVGKGQYTFVGVTCTECHTGTVANSAILPQYAESGHGNVMGDAWIHYNWKWTAATQDVVGSSDRSGCARCHTSTGYKAAMLNPNSPTPPFAANNGDAGNPAEVLSCGACHSDVTTGALRNPGAVTPKSTGNPPVVLSSKVLPSDTATTIANLPDAGKSNGCNYCHAGGGNMFSTWSSSRIPSHHAVAAGVLYGTTTRIGYEFVNLAGTAYLDYTIPAFITSPKHADIGAADGKGPCVSCHMPSLDHRFSVVDERTQSITSQAVCDDCHTVGSAYEMTYAKLEEEKAGYINAGALLAAYIGNTIPNYTGAVVTGAVTAANDRAAWYNFKLFPNEEAGAFAHNRFYVKRLMFDSIDWLQNGVLDGTISTTGIDAVAYAEALAWLGTTRP